ncbi:D-arabinono-1,4-lactone oxidase [Conexibacter sp. CPCC 206217]|uniref:D-arabinono-1,4-lactone oxidase n=1 Tax=Conexibacter sp. CPCC 206217 TaxID=3064574 RepID=UPI002717F0F6|nr:D-arabinono-1,4-lactone oxidase [Conexibacter sp. CPCC 206217]MDO8213011.1 D-arabinono-1,4-lactone oxidase [Conexibacter sp. CPCC 206217]
MWRNWAGDESCRPSAIERPGSVGEVAAALERAAEAGQRVRVAGSGHSFTDVACSDGRLLTLERMDRVLDVDRAGRRVRVEAGITLRALNAALAAHGLALENLGDVDAQTVAGAISTATHGTGARLPNLSAQVEALELVLADGSTLECAAGAAAPAASVVDRRRAGEGGSVAGHDEATETYLAARVGIGSLGVVTGVTLRCVSAFTLHGVDAPAPLDQTLDALDELGAANDHFEFYVFPHTRTALTRTNNRVEGPPRPRARARAWVDDVLLTNHAFHAVCAAGRAAPPLIPALNRFAARVAGRSEKIDRSDRVFATRRLVPFTEMEYALPREHTAAAVRRILALIEERGFRVPFPLEVRLVAPDDALLSPVHGRASGYIAVHMFRGMEWRPYFRAVEQLMDEYGGRPHWGKRHFQTAATLRARYPAWDRFQAVRGRLDPDGRFGNAYTDRVFGTMPGWPARPAITAA